ncbi:hypothetical protein EUGRSUZ_B01229 [Eucalyptus grandis]|uniref:Uncharacterized protein n=2 Tax=Eucalyptus grandis TaxID=71139 RepID=A0ACC3LPL0_EUCGR|nr:hypothetical protein EUGRSUZ_B01229 [Eucalyptus grandis]
MGGSSSSKGFPLFPRRPFKDLSRKTRRKQKTRKGKSRSFPLFSPSKNAPQKTTAPPFSFQLGLGFLSPEIVDRKQPPIGEPAMARYRSRSRSFSPRRRSRSPPRARKPRHGYDDDPRDPRDRRAYRDRRSPAPSGLLLRNLPLDTRAEDLRVPFERFGPVKDVYLPKNYYTGEPRGFGFVKFRYAEDAAEAKQQMNHTVIGGREIRIVFAEENRKTPHEMRVTERVSGRHRERRRSTSRSPRHHNHSYSRSPTPDRQDSRY